MQVDLRRRGLQSFNPAEFANSEEHLQLLLQVRQLDLSYNSLYSIRGLEGLTHLTVLNISHNGLRSLGGGLPLTLEELDASHNSLSTLQNAALLPLQFLTSLDVSFNALEDLRGVPNVTAQLRHLDVRSNRLTSLQGVEHCAQLHTLHAEANLLREVADVASLKCLPALSAVFLAGNPLLLRKRLLHSVRLLLPPCVEQDDIPTTAPPSSVRSSTAPPPSVPDTSSVVSMDHSASVLSSAVDDDEAAAAVPPLGRENAPFSSPSQSGTVNALSAHGSSSARYSRPDASAARVALRSLQHSPPSSASPGAAVVGGDGDSPTCPRRALPHEHRLADPPVSHDDRRRHRDEAARVANVRLPLSGFPAPPHPAVSKPSVASSSRPVQAGGPADRRQASSDTVGNALSRAELEEQLVRVMAERDAYRREAAALRQEVTALRTSLAARETRATVGETDVRDEPLTSAFSDPHTSALQSISAPSPSRTVLSINASHCGDAIMPDTAGRGASRVLAVELSSSSAHSAGNSRADSAETEQGAQRSRSGAVPSTFTTASAKETSASLSSGTQRGVSSASAADRRALAALFMSKLQKSS